jgi:hypothetical protein
VTRGKTVVIICSEGYSDKGKTVVIMCSELYSDKGKTVVIMYSEDYNDKINSFLTDNNFQLMPKDLTNEYQQQLTKTLHNSNQIIPKNQIKYLTQKKPKPPL